MLGGEASWGDDLEAHATFLARFTAEHPVQTNEVGRGRALLRGLQALGRERIDLLELGTAGGLLLYPDQLYPDAGFEVVRRRGIDRHPVDVTTEAGERLLTAFVWPDQAERLDRLRAAIEVARADPPELVEGDYVDLVSDLVEENTVVMSCVTTVYLDDDRYAKLAEKLRGVTWLSLEAPRGRTDYDGMQLTLDGRVLADNVDFHG